MTTPPDDRPPNPRNSHGGDGGEKQAGEYYKLAGLGFEFVAAVGVGIGIGYLVDRWFDTTPWGIIGGVGLGFAVGLRGLIKRGMTAFKD